MTYQKYILIVGLGFIFLMNPEFVFAQTGVKEEIPTGKVHRKVSDLKSPNMPKAKKKIAHIYVKDGKKLLIGNICALEATRKMGFEYGFQHREEEKFKLKFKMHWDNTKVKTKLFFTQGPWWKSKIKKRIQECAIRSGDFLG